MVVCVSGICGSTGWVEWSMVTHTLEQNDKKLGKLKAVAPFLKWNINMMGQVACLHYAHIHKSIIYATTR